LFEGTGELLSPVAPVVGTPPGVVDVTLWYLNSRDRPGQ
jgi:hypothetical protein